ncbi:unnamed protein product [Ophioblennius macclurei]
MLRKLLHEGFPPVKSSPPARLEETPTSTLILNFLQETALKSEEMKRGLPQRRPDVSSVVPFGDRALRRNPLQHQQTGEGERDPDPPQGDLSLSEDQLAQERLEETEQDNIFQI